MSDEAFCGQCGQRIPGSAKFCKFCGSPQAPIEPPPAPVAEGALFASARPAPAEPPPAAPPADLTTRMPAADDLTTRMPPAAATDAVAPPPAAAAAAPPPPPPAAAAAAPPPPAAAAPPPGPGQPAAPRDIVRQAAERVETAAPGAGELAGQLAAQLSTPAVAAAGLAALCTTGLMLAVGLLLALLPAENSLFLLENGSVINQMLVNAAMFTSAPLSGGSVDFTLQTMPMIFILLPLGGMAFFMAAQRSRLELLPPVRRLLAGAAAALPLGLMLLIVALAGKIDDARVPAGTVLLLTLLWGAIGGAAGAWWTMRGTHPRFFVELAPPNLHAPLRASFAVIRPLFVALAVCAVVATAIVTIQTLRDAGDVQGERSGFAATIENALYAPEHGLHMFELGTFVQFDNGALQSSALLPIPVDDPGELVGASDDDEVSTKLRIFDYADAVPSWIFILGLLAFIAVPALFAIYAGFAAARVAGATTPQLAAAFGALTGPVWAILMVILDAVATKTDEVPLWGDAVGGSVFGFTLLVGAVLGAVGGLLAVQRQPGAVAPPPPAAPPA